MLEQERAESEPELGAESGQWRVELERKGDSAAPAGWESVLADPEPVQADPEPGQGKWVQADPEPLWVQAEGEVGSAGHILENSGQQKR